jgi:Phosphorylase superfamily
MEAPSRAVSHDDFTVAWICALPLEMAAAVAMLDVKYDDLPTNSKDQNTYVLGRIGNHNVVIACLPSGVYGTTSATTLAAQIHYTFKSIRFSLMVGIGGGVPSKDADIRLGDVVVSRPTRDYGGVIQYDYGKTVNQGRFQRTGLLNKPPPILLTAIAKMQAQHMLGLNQMSDFLLEASLENPSSKDMFTYCGKEYDFLFESTYDHRYACPQQIAHWHLI